MASLIDYSGFNKIRQRFVEISRFGMNYDDLLIKNSQAIGFIEGELRKRSGMFGNTGDDLLKYSLAISDTTSQLKGKTLPFFQLEYIDKREKLRDLASNAEIEFVLENITDDAIIYDSKNKICKPSDLGNNFIKQQGISSKKSDLEYEDSIKNLYYDCFEAIYGAWGFTGGIAAWQYFYQFLIEGYLAFEILYDDLKNPKKIIGFKELDAATLTAVTQRDNSGKLYLEWLQKDEMSGTGYRTLADSQVIYINYSNFFRTKRVSFVERLLRSFNLLRIMEHSKVIWHIINAPIRLKTTVPIGTKSFQKAKEEMGEFLSTFREDIFFNQDSGELMVDGKPKVLFYKNYVVPKNDRGEEINIEAIEHTGPDLQDSQLLNYFLKKLKLDSKLPASRWETAEGGSGAYLLGADTVANEQVTYGNFIGRLRSAFQEIMIKPWYIQVCLLKPSLSNDIKFKNAFGIVFTEQNLFSRMKEAQINEKGAGTVEKLSSIKRDDGTPMFSNELLVRKYMAISEQDIEENEKLLNKSKEKDKKEESTTGSEDLAGAEDLGMPPSEEPTEDAGAAPIEEPSAE